MKYTANLKLKKPEGTDVVNIDDLNDNVDIIDSELAKKVDKVSGKGLSTNDYTTAEKNKLAGIETGANKYVHPNTHPATMITTSDGKNVETKLTEVFQSGLDGKNLLETSIKSKGGTVSKQGTVATFNELDLGIKSIETDKTGDATAVAGDILNGKTAYAKGKKLTGSMPNRGSLAQTITIQGGQYNLSSGYYSGGYVKAQFANLLAENIKKGVNIGGIVGTLSQMSMTYISSTSGRTSEYKPNNYYDYIEFDWVSGAELVITSWRGDTINASGEGGFGILLKGESRGQTYGSRAFDDLRSVGGRIQQQLYMQHDQYIYAYFFK